MSDRLVTSPLATPGRVLPSRRPTGDMLPCQGCEHSIRVVLHVIAKVNSGDTIRTLEQRKVSSVVGEKLRLRPLLRDHCYRLASDYGPGSFTADDGSKVARTRNLIDNRVERHFVGERHRSCVRRIHIVPGTDAIASEMNLHGVQRGCDTGSAGRFWHAVSRIERYSPTSAVGRSRTRISASRRRSTLRPGFRSLKFGGSRSPLEIHPTQPATARTASCTS